MGGAIVGLLLLGVILVLLLGMLDRMMDLMVLNVAR